MEKSVSARSHMTEPELPRRFATVFCRCDAGDGTCGCWQPTLSSVSRHWSLAISSDQRKRLLPSTAPLHRCCYFIIGTLLRSRPTPLLHLQSLRAHLVCSSIIATGLFSLPIVLYLRRHMQSYSTDAAFCYCSPLEKRIVRMRKVQLMLGTLRASLLTIWKWK